METLPVLTDAPGAGCNGCPHYNPAGMLRWGVDAEAYDHVVALAGNPNVGKSTVFNALTGLRQHTGNWPGKTVGRAEGGFGYGQRRYKLIDLPGTYSLHTVSGDEEIAREFIEEARPDVTVVVVDATRLQRNLNLVLQILEVTDRVVVCLNLVDEARRNGIRVDERSLARALGVPVVATAARRGEGLPELVKTIDEVATGALVTKPRRLSARQPDVLDSHETFVRAVYEHASRVADRVLTSPEHRTPHALDARIDRIVTHPIWGIPIMVMLFALVFWITISGANVPSGMLSTLLVDQLHPVLKGAGVAVGLPAWLNGLLFDGIYLATAWVISVMLPPMAIFFPLFTMLEDFGYLPRVAFNLDHLFHRVGAHGKQSLTMMMGFGCNAAGVVSTRIIDSPRERLVAILTNNFSLCNGRWPTQILIAGVFIGAMAPPWLAGFVSALAVVGVALLGVLFSFASSWFLSKTVLKGEASTFSLELPPYRPPQILRTIYTSLIDRTIYVLWRAVVFAIPAGAAIWLVANIPAGETSLAVQIVRFLDPLALLIGLNGVILLAYVIAIPANEIVIPTVLMLTVLVTGLTGVGAGAGVMFDAESATQLHGMLSAGGWTLLTAVNLMLFSLLHNPCSTTIYTIYKETGSWRWTALATFMPLGLGLAVTLIVATVWRVVG